MTDRFPSLPRYSAPSQPHLAGLRISIMLLLLGSAGISALITLSLLGPTSLASLRLSWVLTFFALLAVTLLWWAGYLWLLRRLAGWDWRLGLQKSVSLTAILTLSLLPDLAAFLSGKLPYILLFNPDTQSLYLWLSSGLLGVVIVGQELIIVNVTYPGGLRSLAAQIRKHLLRLTGWLSRSPRAIPGTIRNHPILIAVLAIGWVQRLMELNSFHGGDMDVILSATYATLQWPPFGYYEAYRPQPWVYNHLPLFPLLLAPSYWLFENLFHWPTVWAAKMQSGFGDMAIAILLYCCAQGRWRSYWGASLAAVWFLAPWVVTADDHAVGLAAAFAVASVAAIDRGWLSGLLLALGVATRNEVAFFVFPLALYFISQRRLSQAVGFFGVFGTTLAVIALPFVLTDPEAMDYAMRRQIQRDASTEMSMLLSAISPFISQDLVGFLKTNPSVLAVAFNILISLIALRDPRPERILVIAAAGYLLTLPLMHQRYIVFFYSLGLFYAARFRDPIVAVLIVAATWPGIAFAPQVMYLLFFGLIVLGLLRREKTDPMVSLRG